MKKLVSYTAIAFAFFIITTIQACTSDSGQTGGAKADSGATNVGNSGATDSSAMSAGSGSPQAVGTSGTDTSGNGKGTTNPTADTLKNSPK